MMRIGIKFCGGCNPRYNRVKVKKEIENILDDKGTVSMAKEGQFYDFLIIISGCKNSCANYSNISYGEILIIKEDINFRNLSNKIGSF